MWPGCFRLSRPIQYSHNAYEPPFGLDLIAAGYKRLSHHFRQSLTLTLTVTTLAMARRTQKKLRASFSTHEQENTSVKTARAGFQDLPNELIYIIRDFLPMKNLRDHIAFQSTCRQVRTLYETDGRFWKMACRAYGVSRPAPSEEFPYTKSKVTWRQLAILIVNHQECCDIPSCQQWQLPGVFLFSPPLNILLIYLQIL